MKAEIGKHELFFKCMNKIHQLNHQLDATPWYKFKMRRAIKHDIKKIRDITPMRFG